jgi:hypothetical protein
MMRATAMRCNPVVFTAYVLRDDGRCTPVTGPGGRRTGRVGHGPISDSCSAAKNSILLSSCRYLIVRSMAEHGDGFTKFRVPKPSEVRFTISRSLAGNLRQGADCCLKV